VLLRGDRLVKGPAYGKPADAADPRADDWPTYRHDTRRTGSTAAAGPARLKPLWSGEVGANPPAEWSAEWDRKDGGRLSAPVVAEGLALVSASDRHRLVALDAKTGERRWSFTAGGRIDSPPTVHRGLCLLGARDGWVYCLRAGDGELVWRFRAAPDERRVLAYGQLESPWPVVGGVLVYEGLAYFAVGRHSASDGGVFVGALEPATGRLVWAERPAKYPGVPDVLTGEDGTVQMSLWQFDARSGKNGPTKEDRLRGGRLGLLNDAWYDRPIAMRKNLQAWVADDSAGQMLAFNDRVTCVFTACTKLAGGNGKMSGHASLSGELADGRDWTVKMPLGVRLRAMALTPERLYVAGLLADEKSDDPPSPVVRAYALADGKLLGEAALDGPPVHDGLIVAGGRVYVATEGGRLTCLGEK
jgi:outer membrane protein assembly factor BamB